MEPLTRSLLSAVAKGLAVGLLLLLLVAMYATLPVWAWAVIVPGSWALAWLWRRRAERGAQRA